MLNEWNGFNDGVWTKEINVRNFIQKNYTLYEGDDSFLADVSQKTKNPAPGPPGAGPRQ